LAETDAQEKQKVNELAVKHSERTFAQISKELQSSQYDSRVAASVAF